MFGTDLPEVWLDYADGSYLVTRLLWFTNFMFEAPVNSHRTIELYLKTYLVSKGQVVQKGEQSWGHDLQQLANLCAGFDNDFKSTPLLRRIVFYQRYHDLVRYPSDLEGKLQDGSLIWFSFDSAILPLDELVAFIRPRISLPEGVWKKSRINILSQDDRPEWSFQRRALRDKNKHLQQIVCNITHNAQIEFDPNFRLDLPEC